MPQCPDQPRFGRCLPPLPCFNRVDSGESLRPHAFQKAQLLQGLTLPLACHSLHPENMWATRADICDYAGWRDQRAGRWVKIRQRWTPWSHDPCRATS
jgi:hypothetical protein